MKKIKVLLLISLVSVISLLLCSCPCYPNTFDWGISGVGWKETLINGNTANFGMYDFRTEMHPLAVHNGMTYIDIKWNNKVVFKPLDSDEELIGRYEVDYHTDYRTYFTITFENGEKTENGNAATHGLNLGNGDTFGAVMSFKFRGLGYSFSAGYEDESLTIEEYEKDFDRFIAKLRSEDNMFKKGSIELHNNGAKIYGDVLHSYKESDELYRSGLIVRAVQITADNELIILDELKSGECMYINYVFYDSDYSSTVMRQGYMIYYIDPLP